MSYKTTPRCDQDIVDIYVRGVTLFGVEQAERYHEGLVSTFDLLGRNPKVARERTEFVPPVRLHPFQSHVIVYVEREPGILIVRVLHGRSDWERRLRP